MLGFFMCMETAFWRFFRFYNQGKTMAISLFSYTKSSDKYGPIETPQVQPPQNEPGFSGNLGRAAGSGALSAVGGIFDFAGADGIARQFYGWSDDARQSMSAEAQADMAKSFFKEDEQGDVALGEGFTDLDTWLLTMANVAGQAVPTMIPGAGIGSVATKALSLGKSGANVANAVGMGATGGAAATGQGMEQARQEYLAMPDEVKAQSDLFKSTLKRINSERPGLDPDSLWNATDEVIAAQLADDVRKDPATLLANFAGSAIADPIIGKALTGARLAKSGAFRSALKGFAIEGATEAGQAGVQEYGINKALAQVDERDPTEGVALAALNEGIAGGAFGGVAGFGGGLVNQQSPQKTKEERDAEIDATVTDPEADAIRDSNEALAQALDAGAKSAAKREADLGDITQVNYEIPAAARKAGAKNDIEAGKFGDRLLNPTMEGELLTAESARQMQEFSANQPLALPDKNIIFAEDGRPLQEAQEFAANTMNSARPALPQKDVIFAPDQSGVTVKLSGQPFQSKTEALASKQARLMKKAGQQFEAVPFSDGWGLSQVATQNMDNQVEVQEVAAPPQESMLLRQENDEVLQEDSTVEQTVQPNENTVTAIAVNGAEFEATPVGLSVSGKPFPSERAMKASVSYKKAAADGELETVKVDGGFGFRPKAPVAPVDATEVQQAATPTEPAADLSGEQLDPEWTAFADDSGTKKIPRAEMPQIKAEHRGAMVNFMNARGVKHEQVELDPAELKPTQAEFSPAKIKKAMEFDGGDRSILVASDGFVLDGHHQWLSKREKGEPIKAIRLDAPIDELIALANEFPSSTNESGSTEQTPADVGVSVSDAVDPLVGSYAHSRHLEITAEVTKTAKGYEVDWGDGDIQEFKGTAAADKLQAVLNREQYQKPSSGLKFNRTSADKKHEKSSHLRFNKEIDALLSGEVEEVNGALFHPEIGEVDIIWGNEGTEAKQYSDGFGLAKILKKHPEVNPYSLMDIVARARKTKAKGNTVELEDENTRLVVKLDWDSDDRKWLLTAFEPASRRKSIDTAPGTSSDVTLSEEEADGQSIAQNSSNEQDGATDNTNVDIKFQAANFDTKKPTKSVTAEQARRVVNSIVKQLNGAAGIKVVVLDNQKQAEKQWQMSLEGSTVRGAYDDKTKTAYVIAENIESVDQLREVVAHEVLAHGGLDTVIGKDKYKQFIDRLQQTRSNKLFKTLWAQIDADYDGVSAQEKAEELFAYYAQNKPVSGPLKFWWNALKRWLHKALASVGLAKAGDPDIDAMDAMIESIRMGFIVDRASEGKAKPATGSERSELAFSRTATVDTRTAKEKLGLEDQVRETIAQQAKARTKATIDTLKSSPFWQRMNEGIFDGMSGIKQAEESVGITDPNQQGYVSARLASGLADVLHAVFNYGAPEWSDGVVSRKADTKGMLEVFGMLGDDLNNWLAWMGANRAEKLMAEGRENNLTPADIAELKALANGKEQLFEQVRQEYNKINSAVITLAQEAGLISPEQRGGFDEEWYVPFFRDMDIDPEMEGIAAMVQGPTSRKGIANQSAKIKELKGGKQSTKDLMENIIQRQSTLIDAALKNKAMLEVVNNLDGTDYMQAIDSPDIAALSQAELSKIGRVRVMHNGKAKAYAVSDPALLRGLLQINDAGSKSLFNRMARSAKRFLTAGITLSPDFIIKNFVRDATHAWMINKDDFKFGADSIKGIKKAFKEDELYRDLIFSGAAFQGGYVHGADPEAAAQQIRRTLAAKGLGQGQIDSYLDSLVTKGSQLFEMYRTASDKFENANRLSTYEAALTKGKSKRQAAFEAKDLMDYSLKGNFALIGTMIDMLPFFNARLQGMSKLVRAARAGDGDRVLKVLSANLAMKGMKVAAFSLALAALNDDDERYQELPDWDKDANWHFFIGDDHFRIPKPFELGILFGTLPERLFNYGTGNQPASDLGKSVAHAVFNTLALNPIPQIALPMVEVMTNRSFFKGSAIEGMADENKQAEDRYNAYTSDVAKLIGEAFGTSPKKIEHVIKGYTGTLGGYVLGIADGVARQIMGVESADTPISRYPVIKAFYQSDTPKTATKYQDEFYDALETATQAYGSYKRAVEEGDVVRQQELKEDEAKSLSSRVHLSRVQRQLSQLSKQAEMVNNNQALTGAQKRERLEDITRKKNALYQGAYVRFKLGEW